MGVGEKYFRWELLEYLKSTGRTSGLQLRVLAVFRGCADTVCTPSISGFDTAGTACTRALYCSYSQYSQCLGRQYPDALSTRKTKCNRYSRCTRRVKHAWKHLCNSTSITRKKWCLLHLSSVQQYKVHRHARGIVH